MKHVWTIKPEQLPPVQTLAASCRWPRSSPASFVSRGKQRAQPLQWSTPTPALQHQRGLARLSIIYKTPVCSHVFFGSAAEIRIYSPYCTYTRGYTPGRYGTRQPCSRLQQELRAEHSAHRAPSSALPQAQPVRSSTASQRHSEHIEYHEVSFNPEKAHVAKSGLWKK